MYHNTDPVQMSVSKKLIPILSMVWMYICQFLINVNWHSARYVTTPQFISLAIFTFFISMLVFDTEFIYWLVSLVVYYCLIIFYNNGSYDISFDGYFFSLLRILLLTFYIFITQVVIWFIVFLIKKFMLKKTQEQKIRSEFDSKKFFIALFFQLGLFILHFVVFPSIFDPSIIADGFYSELILILSTIIVSFIGLHFLKVPIMYWIVFNWLYLYFLSISEKIDAYGIHNEGIYVRLDLIIPLSCTVIFTQIMLWLSLEIVKDIRFRIEQYKSVKFDLSGSEHDPLESTGEVLPRQVMLIAVPSQVDQTETGNHIVTQQKKLP